NEELLVVQVLEQLEKLQYPDFVEWREVVIVDDCSNDNTHQQLQNWIKDKPGYQLHRHTKNTGKGAAVRTGFSYAQGDTFLIQDADLELQPSDIPLMLTSMENLGVSFINGSRYLPGPVRPLSSYKRYI